MLNKKTKLNSSNWYCGRVSVSLSLSRHTHKRASVDGLKSQGNERADSWPFKKRKKEIERGDDDKNEGVKEKERERAESLVEGAKAAAVSYRARVVRWRLQLCSSGTGSSSMASKAAGSAGSAGSAPLSSARSGGIEAVDWRDAELQGLSCSGRSRIFGSQPALAHRSGTSGALRPQAKGFLVALRQAHGLEGTKDVPRPAGAVP